MKRVLPLLTLLAVAGISSAQVGAISSVDAKFTGLKLGGTGKVTIDGNEMNVGVGKLGFDFTQNGKTTSILTVCASLTSILNNDSHNYSMNLTPADFSPTGRAGKIVGTYFAQADTAVKAQGLQLAVWEALTDNGSTFSNSGRFSANSSFGSTTQQGTALYWASQFYSANSGQAVWAKTSASGGQSQMTPVPEPASLAALAVGGAALIRRRRRNSSR